MIFFSRWAVLLGMDMRWLANGVRGSRWWQQTCVYDGLMPDACLPAPILQWTFGVRLA